MCVLNLYSDEYKFITNSNFRNAYSIVYIPGLKTEVLSPGIDKLSLGRNQDQDLNM